ncbi:hypothetical protein MUN84_12755 [Hymenobacter sp. 5516J-16]|uniref:hypothetical protein n=1 Tax=Hymenobacter sp. 5516J-16 TaxID=2932253 RepID=UPI001FD3210D|nr:hypothetical protein [Hymenobacter sp. 5516J-16]UOQ75558.1 hypothetical protein MUN84_12755 [Hymenobacter sp. 5516J-16]
MGAYHGLFLILDRLFLLRLYRKLGALSILPTFVITVVGWVLFRAETLAGALAYVNRMLGLGADVTAALPYYTREFWFTLVLATVFSFMAALPRIERWEIRTLAASHFSVRAAAGITAVTALLLLLSMGYIVGSSFNPFIYFRF